MSDQYHRYEPSKGHGLRHDPLASIIGPRPIGWISTRSALGRFNLAPYSFFSIFSYRPPIVAFSSVGWKDTVDNAKATGEFVVNLATRTLADQVNQSSSESPSDFTEFELAGLTPTDCMLVSAPRVAESPVSMECRVTDIHQLVGADQGKVNAWVTYGEIVAVHIASQLIQDGIYNTSAALPILRGGGPADYFEITDQALFKMKRP